MIFEDRNMRAFEPLVLGSVTAKNRIIRAATFENLADENGTPRSGLGQVYAELAENDVGLIITGFTYTEIQGRAAHPFQAGLDDDARIPAWQEITDAVHRFDTKIFAQISHAGRQTISRITGCPVVAPSKVKCTYFKQKPKPLSEDQILAIIGGYGKAALRARQAGFDGVQVHAAHGYLIHQFLSAHTNRRKDRWGGSLKNRFAFAGHVYDNIKRMCGSDFPVITKISVGDDRGLTPDQTLDYCRLMERSGNVDAIELSYGTMEWAMNIFRGKVPIDLVLRHNPLFKDFSGWKKKLVKKLVYPSFKRKLAPFEQNYNLDPAIPIMKQLDLPVLLTGGVRSGEAIERILQTGFAGVSICRPFVREPDFAVKLRHDRGYESSCQNCNVCAVMCDSGNPTRCYKRLPDPSVVDGDFR